MGGMPVIIPQSGDFSQEAWPVQCHWEKLGFNMNIYMFILVGWGIDMNGAETGYQALCNSYHISLLIWLGFLVLCIYIFYFGSTNWGSRKITFFP